MRDFWIWPREFADRFVVIDGNRPVEDVAADVAAIVTERLS